MARISINKVSKQFGRTLALDNIDLQVTDGEFIALLGASGCGKTTLLRLLAGFETVDTGDIRIDDDLMSGGGKHVPPEKRRVGMVFQAYALWPHMSVRQNVELSLRVQRVPAAKRRATADAALEAVGMLQMAERKPSALSGGQRQRVALARCLAMNPRLVLLDEPLANLDMNLREAMQEEFRRFHAQTGSTMIYVTHDQAEAMALADRIVIMDKGRILQVSPPEKLYREPADETVARFIGKGMLVPVRVLESKGGQKITVELFSRKTELRAKQIPGQDALACLRPEDLQLSENGNGFPAVVSNFVYQGGGGILHLHPLDHPQQTLRVRHSGPCPQVGEQVSVAVKDGWVLGGNELR